MIAVDSPLSQQHAVITDSTFDIRKVYVLSVYYLFVL